jgi:TPR repeat protein
MSISLPAQDADSVAKLRLPALQKLADSGDPAAENELGVRYRVGTDVDKDPAKAVPWFLKAAKQGFAKTYFNLGAAYYNGDGVAVNDLDSCVWFMLSADAGDERGQEALARNRQELSPARMKTCELMAATAYLTGDLVKQDYSKAMAGFLNLANEGDGPAREKLAYMYDRGLGVAKDEQQSFDWLKRSADVNYVPAIFELGYSYETGHDTAIDLDKARKLYEKAASRGSADATIALGRMYEQGRGVKLDRQEALAYYIVAVGFGGAEAKSLAENLSAQLTPKQTTSAKQEAGRISAQFGHPVVLLVK